MGTRTVSGGSLWLRADDRVLVARDLLEHRLALVDRNIKRFESILDGIDNYSHTLDWREKDTITIEVGSEANMGAYGFSSAAVAISPHTKVRWVWSGRGGTHNVVATQGTFNSGEPVSEAGTHFEYTFDRPGMYTYVCEPHEAMGMKGAIFVGLGDPVEEDEATG